MDFVGNALAPNALTIGRDLVRMSAGRAQRGGGRIDYVYPYRFKDGKSKSMRSKRPSVFSEVRSQYGQVDLQATVGFGPLVDKTDRTAAFGDPATGLPSPYVTCYPNQTSPLMSAAGIVPADQPAERDANWSRGLTLYSVSPFVMLVDTANLGGLPVPQSWEDLRDETYRGQVVITPEDPVSNVAVLGLSSLYGQEGARDLLGNVVYSASASVMGRMAGKGLAARGSIYVAPWFFARMCADRPGVLVVWPREGALCFPLFLALREDASDAAREVAGYFTGDDFARSSAANCMPCAAAASDGVLQAMPGGSHKLAWPGWDWLRNLDLEAHAAFAQEAEAGIMQVTDPAEVAGL